VSAGIRFPGKGHRPTAEVVRDLRDQLRERYPELTFFFLAPDIANQVLNFGLAAPIDVQVSGPVANEAQTYAYALSLLPKIAAIPGAEDVHLAQIVGRPELRVNVDRTVAFEAGLTTKDVATDILVSLASSSQVSPNFWLDPKRGAQYPVSIQV